MTVSAPAATVGPGRIALLLLAFAACVEVRVLAGHPQVNASAPAGLLFAALLALLTAAGWRPKWPAGRAPLRGLASLRGLLTGCAGAAVLCLPPVLRRLDGSTVHRPGGGFAAWAAVVSLVAVAEETFLRGTLFAATRSASRRFAHPGAVAIGVTAVAFAGLHLPLYGWGSLPLDLAVGIWLGILRELSSTVSAPAAAHALADLAGWWLR